MRFVKYTTRLLILMTLFCFDARAAFEYKGQGSTYLAGGGCGVASLDNQFLVFINPAKAALGNNAGIDLFYRNFYGIKELNQMSLAATFKLFKIPLAFGINRYGNTLYAENEIQLASAYRFFGDFALGAGISWYMLSVKNYGNAATLGINLSGLYQLNESIRIGFLASNINEPKIGQLKESLPMRYAAAFSYCPLPAVELNFDVIKDADFDFEYRFGFHYQLYDWLSLISGFRDSINHFSLGFGLRRQRFNVIYSFEYHPELTYNNSITVGYYFNE